MILFYYFCYLFILIKFFLLLWTWLFFKLINFNKVFILLNIKSQNNLYFLWMDLMDYFLWQFLLVMNNWFIAFNSLLCLFLNLFIELNLHISNIRKNYIEEKCKYTNIYALPLYWNPPKINKVNRSPKSPINKQS